MVIVSNFKLHQQECKKQDTFSNGKQCKNIWFINQNDVKNALSKVIKEKVEHGSDLYKYQNPEYDPGIG